MSTVGADYPIDRIVSDDLAEAERVVAVRNVYRRAIAEIEIAPQPGSAFSWCGVLRRLPGLGLASATSSGVHITRAPSLHEGDDLILTAPVHGRITVRQGGREASLDPGKMAVTRSCQTSHCEREPDACSIELRVPMHVVAPTARELEPIMAAAISAPEPLAMLQRYIGGLLDSSGIERPETLGLAVAHVHEIVSYILGMARDGAAAEKARGPAAARLLAIKADIVERLCSRELTIVAIAERHKVTARYVRKLFETEGVTFSEFVLAQRLARARRMLGDRRHDGETISAIAFTCGFGDLSYFNRVFRRHFAATPTAVREAARRAVPLAAAAQPPDMERSAAEG